MSKQQTELPAIYFDEIISSIFTAGPSYYYIVDFFDMSITNMSKSVKEIHGLEPENITFNDIINLIHPDDVSHVEACEKKFLFMLYNIIGREKETKYKISYCFRFKTADNSYRLFLHQSITLTLDQEGKSGKSLNIHTNISHLSTENNYKISMIGLMDEPSYLDIDVYDEQTPMGITPGLFSKREMEIARLIIDGFTNTAISLKLNIAIDTVKNHRRNIMKKTNVKNTAQLIKKCIQEGLV